MLAAFHRDRSRDDRACAGSQWPAMRTVGRPVGGPGRPGPRPGEDGPDCTTERPNTHNTDILEVRYLWHPWCGRRVTAQVVRGRTGPPVFRCTLHDGPRYPVLEIPQWMCGRETDGIGVVADTAHVDLATLRALAAFLPDARTFQGPDMVEAQHPSCTEGDADAHASAVTDPPVGTIPTGPHYPHVTPGGLRQDGTVARPPAVRVCPGGSPEPPRSGGGA